MWALLPVKAPALSKQRLKGVLTPQEREALMRAMLRDVLEALADVTGLEGVLVATRSADVGRIALEFSAEIFAETSGADQSQSVMEAIDYLIRRHHAQTVLVLPGDVPRIAASDVNELLEQHKHVTLVPDAKGVGTNAVLASPPDAISFQFGKDSFQRHLASANAAGLSPLILPNEHFAHDIDEPSDLVRALAELRPSYTREFLEQSGIRRRLECQQAGAKVA